MRQSQEPVLFSVFQDVVVARGEGSWDKLFNGKAASLKSSTQLLKKWNSFLLLNTIFRHTGGCSWDNLDTVWVPNCRFYVNVTLKFEICFCYWMTPHHCPFVIGHVTLLPLNQWFLSVKTWKLFNNLSSGLGSELFVCMIILPFAIKYCI